jgi:hypothetical protein
LSALAVTGIALLIAEQQLVEMKKPFGFDFLLRTQYRYKYLKAKT